MNRANGNCDIVKDKRKPMRLIDADKLLARYKERCEGCKFAETQTHCKYFCDIADIISDIEDAPTVDAVEVVRCRKCKWWNEKKRVCEHPEWTDMDGWHKATDASDYCFRAE